MPDFQVQDAKKVDEYSFDGNDIWVYWVRAQGPDGMQEFQVHQKPTSPPPSGTVSGDLTQTKRGELKLKKSYGGRGGGGGGSFKRDPKESKSIVRQHSQHMTLLLFQLRPDILEGLSFDQVRGTVMAWTDWFVKDAEGQTEFAEKQSDVPWDDERPRVAA